MSANLVVDLNGTTDFRLSVSPASGLGNAPASGPIVGQIIDLLHADTFCNVVVTGGPSSGNFPVQVQTSDSTSSGSFTDPTSGLAQFPTRFLSGGIFYVNSGLYASGNQSLSPPVDQQVVGCSGVFECAGFQRLGRYVRALALSGTFDNYVSIGFLSQKKTTGSGPGYSFSPGSGTVNV